jgi:hypothetical protein
MSRLTLPAILNYKYYVINSFVILGPVVMLAFLVKMFKNNGSVKFLILPLLITNLVLAVDSVKNVFYFLLTSVIILFLFLKYVEEGRHKKFGLILLCFSLLYFISYDAEILYYTLMHNANETARRIVLKNSTPNDSIVVDGVADLRIPQSAQILREQIAALKEVGGSTGYGLAEKLKASESDSLESRRLYERVEDYFWGNTKYKNRWLIGGDSNVLETFKPKLMVLFSHYNNLRESYMAGIQPYGTLLEKKYDLIAKDLYYFPDPRLYYRNYYYFQSFFIYKRKNS